MTDPKGIVEWANSWFDNAINAAEGTNQPGPEKKQSVIDGIFKLPGIKSILDGIFKLLGVSGALKNLLVWGISLIIDALVSRKNDSGEFKHSQ